MNRIDATFADARQNGQRVFIPFLTAGDPDVATTARVAGAILDVGKSAGVPVILEIGFPYSDPIADGPTIQASYTRALGRGLRVDDVLDVIRSLRGRTGVPIVAMIAYSLVHRRGGVKFLEEAQHAGLDGVIIPDLPVEEASDISRFGRERDFKTIELVAPTTPRERIGRIVASASGFVYYVSVTGITGERERLPDDLVRRVAELRQETPLPVCVGFGISRPEQVALLRPVADGIIVGSAIVRHFETMGSGDETGIARIVALVTRLLEPLRIAK